MQEIILDRYLTGFVLEGGSDTQYLEDTSSLINSLPICHQPTVCGLHFVKWGTMAQVHTSERKKFTTDWTGGEKIIQGQSQEKECV